MNNHDSENKINNANVAYRTVLIFGVCVSVILLIGQIDPIKAAVSWFVDMLLPVFIGVILAYIVNPFTVAFERWLYRVFKFMSEKSRIRMARGLAVAFSVVFLIAVIALLIFLIIPEFLDNLYKLIDAAPGLYDKAVSWVSNTDFSDNVFMQNFSEYVDTLFETIINWISGEFGTAVSGIIESVISVVSFLFDFLVAIVIFVYALLEKQKFVAQSKKLLYAVCKPEKANDILLVARYGNEVFGKFISGKLLTSTIVGVVTFVFMSAMGMNYALLSAGIIAITNIIPFFGPFIGGIPTAFIVLISDLRQGVIYIIFLLVLQQLEGNIIEPMIMEDKTGLSKFWITFALLLCGGVFGIAGMIFSVPLFAVLFYSIKLHVERALVKKNLPVPSDAYYGVGGINIETNEFYPSEGRTPHKKLSVAVKEWRARIRKKPNEETGEASGEDNT